MRQARRDARPVRRLAVVVSTLAFATTLVAGCGGDDDGDGDGDDGTTTTAATTASTGLSSTSLVPTTDADEG